MKLVKALVALNMARSGAEANRLVKQGSVWIGFCTRGCAMRETVAHVKGCTCHIQNETIAQVLKIPKNEMIKGIDDFVLWKCTVKHGTCTCGGWHKATGPTEDVPVGNGIRIKDGNWRLLAREDGRNGFDQVPGFGKVTNILQG